MSLAEIFRHACLQSQFHQISPFSGQNRVNWGCRGDSPNIFFIGFLIGEYGDGNNDFVATNNIDDFNGSEAVSQGGHDISANSDDDEDRVDANVASPEM